MTFCRQLCFQVLCVVSWLCCWPAVAADTWSRWYFQSLETAGPVNDMLQDAQGQLWLASHAGLYRLHNNKLEKVSHAPQAQFHQVLAQSAQQLWFATDRGLWQWQRQTNHFSALACQPKGGIWQVVGEPRAAQFAIGPAGVYQVSAQGDCQPLTVPGLPAASTIERIEVWQHALIVAVREHGLFRCELPCQQAMPFAAPLAPTRVRQLLATADALYVGTHKHGAYQLDSHGIIQQRWHRDAPPDHALPLNGVISIFKEPHQLWLGLWAGGLQQFALDANGQHLSSSRHSTTDSSTVAGAHVRAILRGRDGNLYVGHENGVSVIAAALNQQGWIGPANDMTTGFFSSNIQTMLPGRHGDWWFGSNGGGLSHLSADGTQLDHFATPAASKPQLPFKSVWQLRWAQQGTLLVATSDGLIQVEPSTGAWRAIGDAAQFTSADVFRIAQASDGSYWLSLWGGGVLHLSANGDILGRWLSQDGLLQDTSYAIEVTADQQVFVLNEQGVVRLDASQHRFVSATSTPMPANYFKTMTVDGAGRLWLASSDGRLWRWQQGQLSDVSATGLCTAEQLVAPAADTAPRDIISPNTSMYLLCHDEVQAVDDQGRILWRHALAPIPAANRTVAMLDRNYIYQASVDGVYRQALSQPLVTAAAPAPVISGARLFNQALQQQGHGEQTALFGGQLQLRYDQDLVTFEFALPGYQVGDTPRFRYRLQPFDRDWLTTVADEPHASYTRLPPGEYQLHLQRLAPNATQASEPISQLQLVILPPWYLTWWAKLMLILLLAGVVVLIVKLRTLRLRQRNQWLEQHVQQRTAELALANTKLQQAAYKDALTGVYNRRGLHQWIDSYWHDWQHRCVLLIGDLDHFKQFNDRYGHHVGDEVLVECAKRLQQVATADDLIARWGGEEFLLILRLQAGEDPSTLQQRALAAQQIIGASPMPLSVGATDVTLTAGMCWHQGQSFATCLQSADSLLYDGKKAGRNRLCMPPTDDPVTP